MRCGAARRAGQHATPTNRWAGRAAPRRWRGLALGEIAPERLERCRRAARCHAAFGARVGVGRHRARRQRRHRAGRGGGQRVGLPHRPHADARCGRRDGGAQRCCACTSGSTRSAMPRPSRRAWSTCSPRPRPAPTAACAARGTRCSTTPTSTRRAPRARPLGGVLASVVGAHRALRVGRCRTPGATWAAAGGRHRAHAFPCANSSAESAMEPDASSNSSDVMLRYGGGTIALDHTDAGHRRGRLRRAGRPERLRQVDHPEAGGRAAQPTAGAVIAGGREVGAVGTRPAAARTPRRHRACASASRSRTRPMLPWLTIREQRDDPAEDRPALPPGLRQEESTASTQDRVEALLAQVGLKRLRRQAAVAAVGRHAAARVAVPRAGARARTAAARRALRRARPVHARGAVGHHAEPAGWRGAPRCCW